MAASQALALGFGRLPESVAFGQALDLAVPLRLDAGERLAPGCVRAEVQMGAQRLPPGALQVALERRGGAPDAWHVRLRSAQRVQEPTVAVNLAVGCEGAVSRQFVVFADPTSTRDPVLRVALADVPPMAPPAASAEPRPRKPAASAKPAVAGPRPAAARLQLDEPEALLKTASLAVAALDAAPAAAAELPSRAEAAASAAAQQLRAVQVQLKTVHDEAAAQRATLEQMRQRLAQAEDRGWAQPLLAAAVAALALLALWLAARLRALQRERQAWQQGATAGPPTAKLMGMDPPEAPAAPPPRQPAGSAEPQVAGIEPATTVAPEPVEASLPVALLEEPLTRPPSVDELIDLEQQAEFFLVLGEEEAAVDLLMSHLRGSDGSSPLPYLQLLQIFRRRGDRDAHERMRERFGRRFDAAAPAWEADPEQGRGLLDDPQVLAALQAAWPRPPDAMAELEQLLLCPHGGQPLELPACRDVLTLYAVARELHREQEPLPLDVDLLLPLAGGDGMASLFDDLEATEAYGAAGGRPTAPVDLDLSEPPLRQDSGFGGLPPVRATPP